MSEKNGKAESPARKPVPESPGYARGKRAYGMIMTAVVLLALSSNPFGILEHILPARWSSKFIISRCRCLYGEPCWPSEASFARLAEEVSQPLLYPKPPGSACYPASSPSGDCSAVQEANDNGIWRSGHPGSMQNLNFESHIFCNGTISACYLNASLGIPCEQGSVPVVGVDARNEADVSGAVRHDYFGRSTARGSFLLWTHHLKDIEYHETFTPVGGKEVIENAITLGAGVQWVEAYDAVAKHGRVIVGGITLGGSVGAAGGWVTGGGHSVLSATHGLGVDNVVQMTVVLSNGEPVIANDHQYTDLFWALRGGGGGTFGVVTSVTYRTHPSTPLIVAYFRTAIDSPTIGPTVALRRLVTEFVRMMPQLSDAGWAGYPGIEPDPDTGVPSFSVTMLAPNVSWAKANESLNPFFEYAHAVAANSSYEAGGSVKVHTSFTVPVQNFDTWERSLFRKTGAVGGRVLLGSRLIPRDIIETKYDELGEEIAQYSSAGVYFLGGGFTSTVDPDSVAVNPAWRKALMHLVFWKTWPEGSSSEHIQGVDDWIRSHVEKLTAIAPDSGAYFNEAYMHQPNPQYTFFGSHYAKLLSVKQRYDPRGLFIVAKGVGHEQWDESINCRV
ncbi:hypothetical protein EUX98_g103 [Antrodiella citrinella]|uniref:FAD-binding PCMH-type domain-containing protein n=1 Tax=Antrodiella citrinella TaxID=2447956 RepID=A0A4S4N6I4_9APHY|nr:hypothetical protein EUX98_g103 [Antrodiella citrinella]